MAIENYDKIAFENDLFYTRDTTNYRVAGTQTASTNVWVGALPEGINDYYDGLTIDYYLPFAGNSNGATLELGGKGAKPVYIDASTRVTDQIKDKSVIRLSYHSTVVSGGAWLLIGGVSSEEYQLPTASSSDKGGIKIGYTQNAKNYPVVLDSDEKAYVNVPWESGSSSEGTVTNIATGTGLTGGPITTTGTISLSDNYGDTKNPYASKTKNYVLAAPSDANGVPSFRALVADDVPIPNGNWLNGSEIGSVRTVGSAAEDSNYTIGRHAVTEGEGTKAFGSWSHAEGVGTTASADASHAEGWNTDAGDECAHAEGTGAKAYGNSSHAEGQGTEASNLASHAEGYLTKASGAYSHAEGGTEEDDRGPIASGMCSHAEGDCTTASGGASHAEGGGSIASGISSHAEGASTIASGDRAHAEGDHTTASGQYSHAGGFYTTAQRRSQTTIGEYNVLDTTGTTTTRGDYAFIIGNGTADNARSNAFTVDWSGNVDVQSGNVKVGNWELDTTTTSGHFTLIYV